MSLLCIRSTPVDSQLLPPAELLYQRKLQSNLPIPVGNQIPDKDQINQRLTKHQQRMKYNHDRSATDLSPLTAGQPVCIQDQATKKWHPGTVSCKRPETRSYEVKTQSGSVLCQNRHHLRPAGTEVIVTEPMEEPATVESGEHSSKEPQNVSEPIETSHTSAPNPSRDIVVSPGTPRDSQSLRTYQKRSGRAVIKPARFTE